MNVPRQDARAEAPTAVRCFTRALKNARYLQKVAPDLFAKAPSARGFGTGIPTGILRGLHEIRPDSPVLSRYPAVAETIRKHPLQLPGREARGSLFNGTFHFAQVTFQTSSGTFVIPTTDMNQIIEYARHAIVPISEYASQYGSNSPTISGFLLPYTANVPSGSYTDADLEGWVNDMASKNGLPSDSCIFVVSPQQVSAQGVDGNAGYHSKANIPYIVAGMFASGLTLADNSDVYAMVVSHEVAEVVVDPNAEDPNGEVCDKCDVNCNNLTRCYFDASDKFLGSNQASPPSGFSFSYYICAMVQPAGAMDCPASHANCQYAPPLSGDGQAGGQVLWSSRTFGKHVVQCAMQDDGNLVLYDDFGTAVWASGSAGHPGAHLVVQDDGNVVIYDRSNRAIWSTETEPRPPKIQDFKIVPPRISRGASITISWTVTQPRDCDLNVRLTQTDFHTHAVLAQHNNLERSGSLTDTPSVDSNYVLEALCPDGRSVKSNPISVAVQNPATGSYYCFKVVDDQLELCTTVAVLASNQSDAENLVKNQYTGTVTSINCSEMATACGQ